MDRGLGSGTKENYFFHPIVSSHTFLSCIKDKSIGTKKEIVRFN